MTPRICQNVGGNGRWAREGRVLPVPSFLFASLRQSRPSRFKSLSRPMLLINTETYTQARPAKNHQALASELRRS